MASWSGRLALCAVLFSALSMGGCASWGLWPGSNTAAAQRVEGVLDHTNGGWTLQACGSEQALPLVPGSRLPELFDQVAQPGQLSIFVELDAELQDGRWLARDIRRMLSTGRGCQDDSAEHSQWVGISFDPQWRVDIHDQGMQLTAADSETGQQMSVISEQLPDGSRNYRDASGRALELWLYPSDCFERSSGDYYYLSATLIRDGLRLAGCGYQGEVDHRPR